MKGVNRVIIVGNLGADPEVRFTASGTAIASLSVATSEEWRDKQSGEKQSRTEWHRVKLFGRIAEVAGEYLKKGRTVYIEGSLRTEKYTDKQGVERYATDVIGSEMQIIGGGGDRESGSSSSRSRGGATARQYRDAKDGAAPAGGGGGGGFDDEDIPFAQYQRGMLM